MTQTRQELFDKAVGGVIKQGRASLSGTIGCSYRGESDCACGIGQLLDDDVANFFDNLEEDTSIGKIIKVLSFDKYESAHELNNNKVNVRVHKIIHDNKAIIPDFINLENLEFLVEIQSTHDLISDLPENEFIEEFIKGSKHMAENFNLEWNFK